MRRANDEKSVSRRKSSSPQKRVVDGLKMVDRGESKGDSTADYASIPITTELLPPPPTGIIKNQNLGSRVPTGKKVPFYNPLPQRPDPQPAGPNFDPSHNTEKRPHYLGRATPPKLIDIHDLYADSTAENVGVSGEIVRGLPLFTAPAPIHKEKLGETSQVMSSGSRKHQGSKDEGFLSRGKKMVDIRKLYGLDEDDGESVSINGPLASNNKTARGPSPSTKSEPTAIDHILQQSSYLFNVEEMELEERGLGRADEPLDRTIELTLNLYNADTPTLTQDSSTSSTHKLKKRTRNADKPSVQPASRKKSASAKKQADVDSSYRARSVYESDCTSNAASDTGTLPQGTTSTAKRRSNVCPYKECSQSFARPWRLAAHIRKHKGERPFRCEVEGCTRDYTNPSHLRRHVLRNHSEPGEKLKCPSEGCLMTLASAATLKRHIERRHGPCNFECELCKQKFRKHGELRVHRLTHNPTLDLLYVCGVCNSGFNDKRLHKKHLRTHRTYPCLVTNCNQVFGTWTVFLKHTKNDHPASKYICDICSRAFTVKKNLEFHLETHKNSSERTKLTCQFRNCNKFYFQQRNLTAHVKRCHCNDTFDCPYPNCTSKLSTKQKLSLHLESVHGLARGTGMQFAKLQKKIEPVWENTPPETVTVKCEVAE